jgi:hypothetical protein
MAFFNKNILLPDFPFLLGYQTFSSFAPEECKFTGLHFILFFYVGEGLHPSGLWEQEEGPPLHCETDGSLGEPGRR